MQNLLAFLYVLGAAATIIATMATSIMSVKPECACEHARHVARLLLVSACALSIARVLTSPSDVRADQVLLVTGLAVVMVLRGHSEARRQQKAPGA